ncbi:MAG: hypothetical protein IKE85_01730 [Mogibacterium sp.]|nr:hypothetical protein [Mogibacterium sp.]
MSGDVIAIAAGCLSAALFLASELRIRSIRKKGREDLINKYKGEGR